MNRKVLLVCYYFPPLGLGGVGRPLNLFRRLPEFDWDCHVLTVKSVAYRAYEPELLEGLDKTKIFRSGSFDPQRIMYLCGIRTVRGANIERARAASSRFFPDPKIGWVRKAIRLGRQLVENYRYDAIISTAPPISCHLVGQRLARDFKLPWIADFRDYWTAYRIEQSYHDPHLIDRATRLKDEITTEAGKVTAVNQTIAAYLGGGEVIYNGYDEHTATLWHLPPSDRPFTIGVVGHQHDSESLSAIYRMIQRFVLDTGVALSACRILHVGQSDRDELLRVLKEENVQLPVEITGRIPREEFVRRLSESSVITFGIPYVGGHDFVPGKLFDLLPSGRPLIVLGNPSGEVAGIVKMWEANRVVDSTDAAASHLSHVYNSLTSGALRIAVRPAYAEEYSSANLASRFATVLNSVVNKNS